MSVNIKLSLTSLGPVFSTVPQIPASGSELEKPRLASLERKLFVTDRWLVGTWEVVRSRPAGWAALGSCFVRVT